MVAATLPGTTLTQADALAILAGADFARRAAVFVSALAELGFAGTRRQAEAYYLTAVAGRSRDEAAGEISISVQAVAGLLVDFDRNCRRPAPRTTAPSGRPEVRLTDPALMSHLVAAANRP
jgi:hypothetical protein